METPAAEEPGQAREAPAAEVLEAPPTKAPEAPPGEPEEPVADPEEDASGSESQVEEVPAVPISTQMFVSTAIVDTGRLSRLLPDGRTETHDFDDEYVIGRVEGDLRVPEDPFLSDRHTRIRRDINQYVAEDLESTNGTFLRLTEERELRPGDQILIGGQILEFVE